jgi:hypothetical protein
MKRKLRIQTIFGESAERRCRRSGIVQIDNLLLAGNGFSRHKDAILEMLNRVVPRDTSITGNAIMGIVEAGELAGFASLGVFELRDDGGGINGLFHLLFFRFVCYGFT